MLVIVALQDVTYEWQARQDEAACEEKLGGLPNGVAEKEIKQNLRADTRGRVQYDVLPASGTGGEIGLVPFIEAGHDQSAEHSHH